MVCAQKKGARTGTPRPLQHPSAHYEMRGVSRDSGSLVQPPRCMCSRIFAPIASMRATFLASASRTTAFCSGENVA